MKVAKRVAAHRDQTTQNDINALEVGEVSLLGPLGLLLGGLGSTGVRLACSWVLLEPLGVLLGAFVGLSGPLGVLLGCSWDLLGCSWNVLPMLLGPPGALCGALGC